MKSVLVLVATVPIALAACASSPSSPPPAAPTAPAAPSQASLSGGQVSAAPVVQKQLITITTKSPEAKAAFVRAWELYDNGRNEEALALCKTAVSLDPDFAFGHQCIGNGTPGAAGQAEYDKAVQLAANLPQAERLFLEAHAAFRHQDTAKGYADLRRVAELAPDDFHAQAYLGYALLDQRDFRGAEGALEKGLALNPDAVFLNATLAFARTQLREYDDALAAARKYVTGAPNEGGAHQALAGALLNVNQTKEAESELTKALLLAPKALSIYYDLASVKAIGGDFAGARDVLDKSKVAEVRPTDGLERARRTAWVLFAEGKNADAVALLEATEKDSDSRQLPWPAFEASTRGWAQWLAGKPADAAKIADGAMARCAHPESSEAYKADCRRDLLTLQAFAQIQAKKQGDAQKTVTKLRQETASWQGNEWVRLQVDMLSDQVGALASKDPKGASELLAKCPPDDLLFKLGILRQAESAGDKATAEKVRRELLGRPLNDAMYPAVVRALRSGGVGA